MELKIEELEHEDSDLTDSDSDEEETSHFQFQDEEPSTGFQMMQLEEDSDADDSHDECDIPGVPLEEATVLHQTFFEKRNAEVLFKQNHEKQIKLDLKEVILLDSQSTMDLFCNPKLVEKVTKTRKKMRLQSNGGSMIVCHKAKMAGYIHDVWFSNKAITNSIAIRYQNKSAMTPQ
jgi:hypothetical protein